MLTAAFSPLTPRHCNWCQGPLQGRSDKQFCSAACRGMAKRHGGAEAAIDWPTRAHAAEQTVHELQSQLHQLQLAQQAAAPFERRYDELSRIVGSMLLDIEAPGSVTNLLTYVTQLLHEYQQHPGLASHDPVAHQRLRNLQTLHATVAKRQDTLRVAKSPATGAGQAEAARSAVAQKPAS